MKQENKQDVCVKEIKQCGIIHGSEYLPAGSCPTTLVGFEKTTTDGQWVPSSF
jgi:hypothetical protein